MIKECLLVALGGATGSIARYLLTLLSAHLAIASEIATFTANGIGSFIIGLLIASTKGEVYLFAAIGFCGGFTTFSTFSAQTIQLFQNGQRIEGIIYIAASVICALIFVGLGLYIGGKFLK